MKQIVRILVPVILLAGVATLCGCNHHDDQRDTQIADLQRSVSNLQANLECLRTNELEFISVTATNMDQVFSNQDETRQTELWHSLRLVNAELTIENLSNSIYLINERYPGRVSAQPVVMTDTRDGIPMDVYNLIVSDAKSRWPTDFEMQKYEIDKQVAAWKELHGQ